MRRLRVAIPVVGALAVSVVVTGAGLVLYLVDRLVGEPVPTGDEP